MLKWILRRSAFVLDVSAISGFVFGLLSPRPKTVPAPAERRKGYACCRLQRSLSSNRTILLNGIVAYVLAILIASSTSATGAVITVLRDHNDGRVSISVDGDLIADDGDRFANVVVPIHSALVSFNSAGGMLTAGIQIGETIRQRGFDTVIKNGRVCASACALAWLAGANRYIEGNGKIGFHAAYNAASGLEDGVGNALVGAYVAKLGLSYSAVVYVTKAHPNEMNWLSISDAAAHGISVSLGNPAAERALISLPTRFGNVDIVQSSGCCEDQIRFKSSRLNIFLNENGFAKLEAVFRVSAGDLLIISTSSNVRGMSDAYYAVLITPQSAANIGGKEFGTQNGTFSFEQVGNEIRFDLGYDNKRKKNAIYREGNITVYSQAQAVSATLSQADCAEVLTMAATCSGIASNCTDEAIWGKFAMVGQRFFNSLENKPVFSTERFYGTCRSFCRSKTYSKESARLLLCGY